MANEGIEINDEVLNGGELLFDSSFIQSDDSCLMAPTEDEPDIVQLPDAADAGIGIATDDADTDFQGQAGAVASKMKKKMCAMALVSLSVLLALVVGLSVGLGTKNGNKSVSSANNAVTLEDCLQEEKALEESTPVPTWMSTTLLPSYEPMAFSLSEETEEEEESAATIGATPVGYSNDFAGMTVDVQESNGDDGLVRRDLRGSSSVANKVDEMKASSKSRRLQCNELLADRTSSGSSSDSSISQISSSKSSKGKAGKKGKKRDKSLIAILAPIEFPQRATADATADATNDDPKPSGTVSLNYNPDGSFLLSLDAALLGPGYVAISSVTSCNPDDLGFLYYDDSSVSNPWGERSPAIEYTTSEEGFSNSAWRIDNGFGSQENDGHAFWLFDSGPIACGVLGVASDRMFLAAEMGVYPEYDGSLVVTGSVRVTYRKDGTFKLRYNLEGLEANCEGCGIHIHAGTDCDSAMGPKGHGWNSEVVQDLWTADGGATYDSDAAGNAEGYFNMYNGYSFGKNVGHAVVVHGQSGERVACGVLEGVVHESEMGNL